MRPVLLPRALLVPLVALAPACGEDSGTTTSATAVTTMVTGASLPGTASSGDEPTTSSGSGTTLGDSTGAPTTGDGLTGGPLLDLGMPDFGGRLRGGAARALRRAGW